jgi:hypothetical protein
MKNMKDCMRSCIECSNICQETLFEHCLEMGGEHVEKAHVKLMEDCIRACQTAADFMARNSQFHAYQCETCAKICEACASSCEEIGGEQMKKCADICRNCADTCSEMGKMKKAA